VFLLTYRISQNSPTPIKEKEKQIPDHQRLKNNSKKKKKTRVNRRQFDN